VNGAASYSSWHENVRIMITELFKQLYKDIAHKRVVATGRREYVLIEKLFETPQFIPLIMPQEIYTADGTRKRVDMAFGRAIVLELKSNPREFDDAYEDALTKYLPNPRFSSTKYFTITDFELWRIYKVKRIDNRIELEPIAIDTPRSKAEKILKTQVLPDIEPKVPAHPDIIGRLFSINADILISKIKEIFDRVMNDPGVKPLYAAYTQIMRMLYGESPKGFFEELFARHTLMHMIALASLTRALDKTGNPVDVCSGILLDVDVALPYLNWWRVIYVDPRYRDIISEFERVIEDVVLRVNLIDWSYAEAEDVFRMLYELLVDPDTRRKIGEYYTPLWLVEYILNEFDLRGKVVLDPFCGSGTFLVLSLHKRIREGEDIDKAYSSLVGFDINPLAVAVARAELILTYLRKKGCAPSSPPRIYHSDTLASWFGGETFGIPEVMNLFRSARDYLEFLLNLNLVKPGDTYAVLEALSEIESGLSKALRYAYQECELEESCLAKSIERYLSTFLSQSHQPLTKAFLEHSRKTNLSRKLASLVVRYHGNSVWASVLVSIYAPLVLTRVKPHVIVTNPPWIPTTEFQAPYANNVRNKLSLTIRASLPRVEKKRIASIVTGSDIATAALAKAITMASEGVAFVMNREQSFYHKNPMPAGILATYTILRKWKGALKLVDVDYDAFKHGIYPALIIVKEGRGEELLVATIASRYRSLYNKSLHFTQDLIELRKLNMTYGNYIVPSISYFSEDMEAIARRLGVRRIISMGGFIRGILGGELGRQQFAGLVLEEYREVNGEFEFKLSRTSRPLRVLKDWLGQYNVYVYELVYGGEINPFRLCRLLPILLSERGRKRLSEFLKKAVEVNKRGLTNEDIGKIYKLIDKFKQPSSPETLNTSFYYVVYRCDRMFTATIVRPGPEIILHSNVSALECEDENQAFYYTAVLNYLVYKAVKEGRRFIRHQYARPALAIVVAGLEWSSVNRSVKDKVIKLSKALSQKAPTQKFSNQRKAINHIAKYKEFKKLEKLFDKIVDKDRLDEALDFVSGS